MCPVVGPVINKTADIILSLPQVLASYIRSTNGSSAPRFSTSQAARGPLVMSRCDCSSTEVLPARAISRPSVSNDETTRDTALTPVVIRAFSG